MHKPVGPATEKQKKAYAHYLAHGEKMAYFTGLSRIYLFRKLVWRFVFPGVLVIIGATAAGYYLLKIDLVYALLLSYALAFISALIPNYFEAKGTQYILTDRRVIMQLGYFNVSLTSAVYDKITHVDVRQSFMEKSMLMYGTVIIHTAGSNNTEIVISSIAHPMHFKNLLEKLADEAQRNHDRVPKWKSRSEINLKKIL